MKVQTKLALLSILLIAVAIVIACIMIFSFARESALSTAYHSGITDYNRFSNALTNVNKSELREVNDLTNTSYLKYAFSSISGASEYALQAEDGTISNNTGINAWKYLEQNGIQTDEYSHLKYGYVTVDGNTYLIIGAEIYVLGTPCYLSLVRDITPVFTEINSLALKCFTFCAALLAASALTMLIVVKKTMKPLSVLQKGVKRVASGKYDEYIHIDGKNEFSELAADYNEMAKAVDDKITEIEKVSEDRKLLLSALAHEMRTPVAAITAYAHTLSHVKLSEEETLEALSFVNEESLRLERLSGKLMQLISLNDNDSLDFTDISAGQLHALVAPILAPLAENSGMQLSYDTEEASYSIDTDLIICLLSNLFDNAKKAGASRIEICFSKDAISVTDNGCGIPEDKLSDITKPFYKIDRSGSSEGFGLGLSLAERIAQAHGARLLIESNASEGTRISLLLKSLQFHDDFE